MGQTQKILLNDFKGLVNSIADPRGNTFKDCLNINRKRVDGEIRNAHGYELTHTLPQATDAEGENYLDPAIHKITDIVWKAFHNFYVADQGGKEITLAVCECKKGGFFPGLTPVDTMAIFAKPYYNGSAWIDDWQELTEVFTFEYMGGSDVNPYVYIDGDSPLKYDFATIDPNEIIFGNGHFTGWMLINYLSGNYQVRYIYDSYFIDGKYTLEIEPPSGLIATAGDKLFVARINLSEFLAMSHLPGSIEPFFYNVKNETRITTGKETTAVVLAVGYKNKTFGWTQARNGLFLEHVLPGAGASITLSLSSNAATNPEELAAGTYYFGITVMNDDGQESAIIDSDSITIPYNKTITVSITSNEYKFPVRSSELRLYAGVSLDAMSLISTFSLITGDGEESFLLTDPIWDNRTPLLELNIGRNYNDTGEVKFSTAAVIGTKTFLASVYDGVNYKNQVFVSAEHGEGYHQYDVFPNNTVSTLDVEYGDGDEITAVASLNDKIIVTKKRSIIVLMQTSQTFERMIVTKGYGICAAKTLQGFDDYLIGLDYSGAVILINSNYVNVINNPILEEFRTLSDATKEAAFAVMDRDNKQYRLHINNKIYVCDLDGFNWTRLDADDTIIHTALTVNGKPQMLGSAGIYTVKDDNLQNTAGQEIHIETNNIYPHHIAGVQAGTMDIIITKIVVVGEFDNNATLEIFINDSAVVCATKTLPTGYKRFDRIVDDIRCSWFRIKIKMTASAGKTDFKVTEIIPEVNLVPIMGDIKEV